MFWPKIKKFGQSIALKSFQVAIESRSLPMTHWGLGKKSFCCCWNSFFLWNSFHEIIYFLICYRRSHQVFKIIFYLLFLSYSAIFSIFLYAHNTVSHVSWSISFLLLFDSFDEIGFIQSNCRRNDD